MTWFKVDDGFWSHPKTATLSDSALALWLRAGSYCCQHLTDGFVADAVLRLLGKRSAANELTAAGLWRRLDNGWSFHDWDEYQEIGETVKKRREQARDRQRRSRESREESRSSSRVTDGVSHGVSSQPPTRPDPTPVTDVTGLAPQATPRTRGTRLDPDWHPSQDVYTEIRAECPHVDLVEQHKQFVDYWTDKTGAGATKVSWVGTWRNWMRRAERDRRPANGHHVNGVGKPTQKALGWEAAGAELLAEMEDR